MSCCWGGPVAAAGQSLSACFDVTTTELRVISAGPRQVPTVPQGFGSASGVREHCPSRGHPEYHRSPRFRFAPPGCDRGEGGCPRPGTVEAGSCIIGAPQRFFFLALSFFLVLCFVSHTRLVSASFCCPLFVSVVHRSTSLFWHSPCVSGCGDIQFSLVCGYPARLLDRRIVLVSFAISLWLCFPTFEVLLVRPGSRPGGQAVGREGVVFVLFCCGVCVLRGAGVVVEVLWGFQCI